MKGRALCLLREKSVSIVKVAIARRYGETPKVDEAALTFPTGTTSRSLIPE